MWLDRLSHSRISARLFAPVALWTHVLKRNWIRQLINPNESMVCGANKYCIYTYIWVLNSGKMGVAWDPYIKGCVVGQIR